MTGTRAVDPRVEAARKPPLAPRDGVDALFVLVLTAVALFGFRTTYSGHDYLVTGILAAALGIAIAVLVAAFRQSVLLTAVLLVVAYYLFGGVLVLRDAAAGGVLPTGDVVRELSTVAVDGWKRLLTTLPPVASDGRLLALPYLIGLLSAGIATSVALRTRARFLPAVAPALALVAVILLGTSQPSAELRQGVIFGALVICWAALRRSGNRRVAVRSVPGGVNRLVVGAAVLAVAGAGAAILGPHLPGHDTKRLVLRNYVKPPFDLATYPSPLVGFRKYTKSAHQLYDQPLFTAKGLPAADSVRLATLDAYDGAVWGATNGAVPTARDEPLDAFQRVGSRITSDARGKPVTARVTIRDGYAAASDVDPWVPTVGTLQSIRFTGDRADAHEESFRYNLATGSGVVADRLGAGDSYTLRALQRQRSMPRDAAPAGTPTLDPSQISFVASRANQWSAKANGVIAQAETVGKYMRDHGAYSDGGPGETEYLPGHSVNRLTNFLNAPQLVGDDEQYAAAYALICNYLGLPARVVLLAEPEAGGVVRGKDVHTAVEVHVRSGSATEWISIPRRQFMPDQSKKPNKRPPQVEQDADAAVVPPPNPVRPPSTLDQPDRPDQNTQHLGKKAHKDDQGLSGFSYVLVMYVGAPLLLVALLCALIIGAKWRRAVRRRTRGSTPTRFDAGWREFVDWARDYGAVVPGGRTRYEQALALAERPAGDHATPLAAAADAGVFGPGIPHDAAVEDYWRDVADARRAMAHGAGRWRRLRAALNLRSLRKPTPAVAG